MEHNIEMAVAYPFPFFCNNSLKEQIKEKKVEELHKQPENEEVAEDAEDARSISSNSTIPNLESEPVVEKEDQCEEDDEIKSTYESLRKHEPKFPRRVRANSTLSSTTDQSDATLGDSNECKEENNSPSPIPPNIRINHILKELKSLNLGLASNKQSTKIRLELQAISAHLDKVQDLFIFGTEIRPSYACSSHYSYANSEISDRDDSLMDHKDNMAILNFEPNFPSDTPMAMTQSPSGAMTPVSTSSTQHELVSESVLPNNPEDLQKEDTDSLSKSFSWSFGSPFSLISSMSGRANSTFL